MTKQDIVRYIADKAGRKLSANYIAKVARKRSSEALARIVDFMDADQVSPAFAYSVMTNGIYE